MLSRRRFVRTSILGTACLGCAVLIGKHLGRDEVSPTIASKLRVLSPKEYVILTAAARRITAADQAGAPTSDELDIALFVDGYLAKLEPGAQRDVKALLQLLEHAGGFGVASFSRFSRLREDKQDAVLRAWQSSAIALYRQGLQGLRTLVFLGYYSSPKTWPMLSYGGPVAVPT